VIEGQRWEGVDWEIYSLYQENDEEEKQREPKFKVPGPYDHAVRTGPLRFLGAYKPSLMEKTPGTKEKKKVKLADTRENADSPLSYAKCGPRVTLTSEKTIQRGGLEKEQKR